jgi:NAD dependent epimerase/dehydratase family enzyme
MDKIDWIPVDGLTRVIVDLMLEPNTKGVYNVVNPATTTWAKGVLPVLQRRLSIPTSGVVPYAQWLTALESAATSVDSDADLPRVLPAVKLIDNFRAMEGNSSLRVSIDALLKVSATARSMCEGDMSIVASEGGWLNGWMEEWGL